MTILVEEHRCESCHEPTGEAIGAPCPADCQHSRVVLAIETGRYCVEISDDNEGGFRASGLIGENLSREFGVKQYKSLTTAKRKAVAWLESKSQD